MIAALESIGTIATVENPNGGFRLTVLSRTRHDNTASEIKTEELQCVGIERAADDFALYREIYGSECAVVVTEDGLRDPVLYHFPSTFWASNLDTETVTYSPYVGLAVSECYSNDVHPAVVTGTKRNGAEITVGPVGSKLSEGVAYSYRKDGKFWRKGSDIGQMPYLILGVAASYRNRDI